MVKEFDDRMEKHESNTFFLVNSHLEGRRDGRLI
jgi:hypothetical protein